MCKLDETRGARREARAPVISREPRKSLITFIATLRRRSVGPRYHARYYDSRRVGSRHAVGPAQWVRAGVRWHRARSRPSSCLLSWRHPAAAGNGGLLRDHTCRGTRGRPGTTRAGLHNHQCRIRYFITNICKPSKVYDNSSQWCSTRK